MVIKKGVIGLIAIVLIFNSLIMMISAEKLEIQIKNSSAEEVNFKINLYDDAGNKINGNINYNIQDYYTNVVKEGILNSGRETNYQLPKNPVQGPWKISASYNNVKVNELFDVGKLEKAEIRLEGENLVVENIGNMAYDKNILVYIGGNDQTARVYLGRALERNPTGF